MVMEEHLEEMRKNREKILDTPIRELLKTQQLWVNIPTNDLCCGQFILGKVDVG